MNKRDFIRRCALISGGLVTHGLTLAETAAASQRTAGLKEAMFQENTTRGVVCRICPNECILREGELSKCNSRRVIKSKLWTLAYSNPCSVNIDPIEKKPFYHFLPGTRTYSIAAAGCNLSCLNCQNWSISQTGPEKTRNLNLPPDRVVEESIKSGSKSIAYTYSEPVTFYEYSFDTARLAKSAGLKNLFKTNGYINRVPLEKICTVLDAANIDLKSFNDNTYIKLSGGRLQPVLDSLKVYRDNGVWLEITSLIVPSWTDRFDEIKAMCGWLSENGFSDYPLHFSRFYPVYKLDQLPPTPPGTLNRAARIAMEEGIRHVFVGNVPGNELADTKCPSCGTVVIKRTGYRIDFNKMADGRCNSCKRVIAGVWT